LAGIAAGDRPAGDAAEREPNEEGKYPMRRFTALPWRKSA
jgi:hypothetical protein